MTTMAQRAIERRKTIIIKKVDLHSIENHSFHIHLDVKKSWELLTRLSHEAWIEKTGQIPPSRVDKSIYQFIRLEDKA